ncbi:response regulator [Vibrio sp. WXL103]|uniref:response regulator n=1 Tax=Vibrio sp. WXL103 TaxID=3450710 RepID=UPI003EC4EDA9
MNILVCDDSIVARKSIIRSIEPQPHIKIYEADDGVQAISLLKSKNIDALFLDLTMPVMDGFEVLNTLPVNSHPTTIVVYSADVQQQAKTRCRNQGAHFFISKPFEHAELIPIYNQLSIPYTNTEQNKNSELANHYTPQQKLNETVNIALGKGAAIMANHLNHFIELPIPHVGYLTYGEVSMAMADVLNQPHATAVTQRFVGGGIHGEALVCLRGEDVLNIGIKLGYHSQLTDENEVFQNIANLLVSSFLLSFGELLDRPFSLRQPALLSRSASHFNQLKPNQPLFAIEYTCFAEDMDFECEVLFMVDQPSVAIIFDIMENI